MKEVEQKVSASTLVDNMIEWLNVEVVKSKTNAKNKKSENALTVAELSDLTKTLSTMIKVINDAKAGLLEDDDDDALSDAELVKKALSEAS